LEEDLASRSEKMEKMEGRIAEIEEQLELSKDLIEDSNIKLQQASQ
jgi:hypothetical protein